MELEAAEGLVEVRGSAKADSALRAQISSFTSPVERDEMEDESKLFKSELMDAFTEIERSLGRCCSKEGHLVTPSMENSSTPPAGPSLVASAFVPHESSLRMSWPLTHLVVRRITSGGRYNIDISFEPELSVSR